jgi:tetratricopeptide (TPR) repeat protein
MASGLSSAHADDASEISAGPTSAQEAKILWQDGKNAFDHGMDEDAIPKLERFVARYPGYPQYLEARHVLAQAYLRLHEPDKARPELKAFIQARGKSPSAVLARNELCRADLELKLYSEALLTADETVKLATASGDRAHQAEALTLRARAQIGLGQDARATDSLASALKALPTPAPSPLLGDARALELELKLRHCARFPSDGKLEEAQVRDQLGRRGACLMDSLLLFKNVLLAGDAASGDESEARVSQAYASYWENCLHPPTPPPIRPKDRDARQLKTYFRELAVVLEEDCRQKIRQGQDLIQSWKSAGSSGPHMPSMEDALKKASSELEKLK